MGLEAKDKTIYELLNDRQFIVPTNQRKYVWDKNNWEELMDDIKLVLKERKPDHFIGSVVLKEEEIKDGIKNHFTIIDGQQRISTITILFAVISYIYVEIGNINRFNGIKKSLFVTDNKGNEHTIVCDKANKDIDKLISFIYGDYKAIKESGMPLLTYNLYLDRLKIDKKVKDCFVFYYENIHKIIANDPTDLEKIQDIINDIRYIDIIAEKEEDAYTIFEILNARGKPLTDFELLRNFLLKYCKKDEKLDVNDKLHELENILKGDIDIFLKHYVTHRYGRKADKNENRPYKIITKAEKDKDKRALLDDIILKSKYYDKIVNFTNCSNTEKKIFMFFKQRRQQQFRPIVLGLMHQLENNVLDQETYEASLYYLYYFFICYNVIGDQTSNKIEDIVYGYSEKIENSFSLDIIIKMKKSMISRMPSEEHLKNSIKNIKYSNKNKAYSDNKKAENIRAIFEVLERENGYKGDLSNTNVNIEHCYPDCLDMDEKNYTIGNLMLLEIDLNERCRNKSLEEKMNIYKESELTIPIILANNIEKNNFEIDSKTSDIAEQIYNFISRISNNNTLSNA